MSFCLDCPSRYYRFPVIINIYLQTVLLSFLLDSELVMLLLSFIQLIRLSLGEMQTGFQVVDLSGQVVHSWIYQYLHKAFEAIFLLL